MQRCDKRCHTAKRTRCRCWCQGLFHGPQALKARIEFYQRFSVMVPPTEEEFVDIIRSHPLGSSWRGGTSPASAKDPPPPG